MTPKNRMLRSASGVIGIARTQAHQARDRARSIRDSWQTRRYFKKNPSRAADPGIRQKENGFYQIAAAAVADIERIESSRVSAAGGDTAAERRSYRADAVAATYDAKRAFPHLARSFDTEIDHASSQSSPDVVHAAHTTVESVESYLLGETVSDHLHPTDALLLLHSALHDQDQWDRPTDQ